MKTVTYKHLKIRNFVVGPFEFTDNVMTIPEESAEAFEALAAQMPAVTKRAILRMPPEEAQGVPISAPRAALDLSNLGDAMTEAGKKAIDPPANQAAGTVRGALGTNNIPDKQTLTPPVGTNEKTPTTVRGSMTSDSAKEPKSNT